MAAMREPVAQRVVVLSKARYPDHYFDHLVGFVMPAAVVDGRVWAGRLVAASETPEEITLTFEALGLED